MDLLVSRSTIRSRTVELAFSNKTFQKMCSLQRFTKSSRYRC